MLKRSACTALVASWLALAQGVAGAATVSRLVGDQDGFDAGTVLANGDLLDRFFIPDYGVADQDLTDRIVTGDQPLTADFTYSGTITSAQIEVFAGGWGLFGAAGLYVNGVFVGFLTITEDVATLTETVYKDTFDLTPLLSQLSLSGRDTIEIRAAVGPGTEFDTGAIDYALITVSTSDTTSVPEPATPALAALALAAAALARRRS